ncbi:MAG: flagellar basal-body rod protein FlgG [Firmicutes bacterium]|nr:flagellar basal-body rod protein FlgG [Bacillota bacterium]
MIRALWTAGSGMNAQQMNIDVIANNLANVNTTGYKKVRLEFQDLLYQTIRVGGTASAQGTMTPVGLQVGHGARAVASNRIFSQGDLIQTNNALDLVIEGDGFFQILLPDGTTAYTRDGTFKLDGEGRITTADGFILQPEITIPENTTSIVFGNDGTVSIRLEGEDHWEEIGQIELVRFLNPAGLESIGKNLFRATAAAGRHQYGTPGLDGFGTIAQGMLEMSNVKTIEEMVNMITAQRAYEINSNAIRAADEMLQVANNLKR